MSIKIGKEFADELAALCLKYQVRGYAGAFFPADDTIGYGIISVDDPTSTAFCAFINKLSDRINNQVLECLGSKGSTIVSEGKGIINPNHENN